MRGPVAIGKDFMRKGGRQTEGPCSWCCNPEATHTAIVWYRASFHKAKIKARRDIFRCDMCANKTVPCMKKNCNALARAYDQLPNEKYCDIHKGLLESWSTDGRKAHSKHLPCSWCFAVTEHGLMHHGRKIYECYACGKTTVPCKKGCEEAMAREYGLGGGECLKCRKMIDDWNDPDNQKQLQKKAWCSWCLEKSTHTLLDRNKIRRNEYSCDFCSKPTMTCMKIGCNDGMSKKGPTNPRCAKCKSGKSWKDVQQRKKDAYTQGIDMSYIEDQLSRKTKQREAAQEAGLLRPFLLLVSMHPAIRVLTASTLDIDLFAMKDFGDPHKEAHKMLFANRTSLRARSKGRTEKIGQLGVPWYDMLFRLNRQSFQVPGIEAHMAGKSGVISNTPNSEEMLSVENAILEVMATLQRGKLPEEFTDTVEALLDTEPIKDLKAKMESAGLKNENLQRWVVECCLAMVTAEENGGQDDADEEEDSDEKLSDEKEMLRAKVDQLAILASKLVDRISKQILSGQGYFSTVKKRKQLAKHALETGAHIAVLVPVKMVLFHVCPPVAVTVLVACIVERLSGKLLSSDIPSLLPAVCHILVHSLFLAAMGIDVNKFY